MKKILRYISPLLVSISTLIFGSCVDEMMYDSEKNYYKGNTIRFDVSSGFEEGKSPIRTRGEEEGLSPVLLTEGKDTLYLHRYVAEESERTTGHFGKLITRATPVNGITDFYTLNAQDGFKVLARFTDNNDTYFPISTALPLSSTSQTEIWQVSEPVRVWPAQKELRFNAFAPAGAYGLLENLDTEGEVVSFNYTVPISETTPRKDAEVQPDLMLATTIARHRTDDSHSDLAPLNFRHALSAIKFAVRDVSGGEIIDISIMGVAGSGKCSYNNSDGFVWSELGEKANYTQSFNYQTTDVYPADPVTTQIDMPSKTFMLVPQEINPDATLEITLKTEGEEKVLKGKLLHPDITRWEPGKTYTYTISTSSENWVYIFSATGNHDSHTGAHNVAGDQVYVYSPGAKVLDSNGRVLSYPHDIYGDKAYFNVRSFRYRANNPSIVEDLKWTASFPDGVHQINQYIDHPTAGEVTATGHEIEVDEWIQTQDFKSGDGSSEVDGERRDLEFLVHHQTTDWTGDMWMQDQLAYSGNSKENMWDLSTFGQKNESNRNTANCYVIDREGWYCFPTVYGNALKNGSPNVQAYEYQGEERNNILEKFVDYKGESITSPWIPINYCHRASIIWTDVYNAVSEVGLSEDKKSIYFHANRNNLQQGNAIIALYDANDEVVWSWHIWITEHWLDTETGKPNCFNEGGSFADYESIDKPPYRRLRGDVLIDNDHVEASCGYWIAPYDIGWCDPKNVNYYRRKSSLIFVQYKEDGEKSGKIVELPVIQDGERVEYKFGNNTYYQWGRKDPIVGFVDHHQTVKRNFGSKKYALVNHPTTIKESIKTPETFYYEGDDWSTIQYWNLWNNYSCGLNPYTDKESIKSYKTIYDPCPAGYKVPTIYMYRFVGTNADGLYYNDASDTSLEKFYGFKADNDDYTYVVYANKNGNKDDDKNKVWLTSTGNRWYTDTRTVNGIAYKGGDNFNDQMVYLWSANGGRDVADVAPDRSYPSTNGYCLAIGQDPTGFCICSYFPGRKSMARPVRPIRE